jgi:hypothetical protein
MRRQETADLAAMTVNERLFARGSMDDFDRARAAGDVDALRAIFARIELPDYPVEELLS